MDNKKYIKLMAIFIFFNTSPLLAKELTKDFVIAGTPQFLFKMEVKGKYQGIDIDIIQKVMQELKIPYTIKLIKSNKRLLTEAKNGHVDMLISLSKKASRMECFDYPQQSYKQIMWHFFIRKPDQGKIHFNTFDDLKGLRVGATHDISYTSEFWNAKLNLSMASKNTQQIPKLLNNRIDIVPMNTVNTLYEAQQKGYLEEIIHLSKPLKSSPYYNPFPKASTYPNKEMIMQHYDQAIKKMQADGTIQAIFDKYLTY